MGDPKDNTIGDTKPVVEQPAQPEVAAATAIPAEQPAASPAPAAAEAKAPEAPVNIQRHKRRNPLS